LRAEDDIEQKIRGILCGLCASVVENYITAKTLRRKDFAIRRVRHLGGKPVKTGGDVDAAAKKRPEEALFAALRTHDYRLRTCSRAPTA